MTTPTTAELLKYADLQMAAEAFLVRDEATGQLKSNVKQALIEGNGHSSKFTEPQALEFLKHWEVIAQRPNASTGFSGTLFKCILSDPATGAQRDELVMSFRSTEFIDDSARDNQATNAAATAPSRYRWPMTLWARRAWTIRWPWGQKGQVLQSYFQPCFLTQECLGSTLAIM
jgi:hypothetical protein